VYTLKAAIGNSIKTLTLWDTATVCPYSGDFLPSIMGKTNTTTDT
jgi:hypothetical protein